MSLTIKEIREAYPNAKIVIATQATFKRIDYDNFPTNNNQYSLPQFNAALRELADFFGCYTIDFDKCGITFENCYEQGYITDSSATPTHPNNKGHELMGKQAIRDLTTKLGLDPADYPYIEITPNTLYEHTGVDNNCQLSEMSAYFTYDYIPVVPGTTYYMPHCRNTALLDAKGNVIRLISGPAMEQNGYMLTVPAGVIYLRTCARYDAISVEEFSMTEVVLEQPTYVLYENSGVWTDALIIALDGYFAYDFIPVEPGKTYYMPHCRNTAVMDAKGNVIRTILGGDMEKNGYILTIPQGAAYLRTCARYDTISVKEFYMEEHQPAIETNVLYEGLAVGGSDGEFFSTNDYFSYDFIPVEAGKTYSMPFCRNTAMLDNNGQVVGIIGGPNMEQNGYLLTVPANVAYLRTCARYDAISVEKFSVTEV
jgi:hypothetical protein